MNAPTLSGTPKQIAYANAIRASWIASQHKQIEIELTIIAGNPPAGTLVEGTEVDDELRDAFVAIVHKRQTSLSAMLTQRATAKAWIESTEAAWFRLNKGAK